MNHDTPEAIAITDKAAKELLVREKLLFSLKEAEIALSHLQNSLHVRVNPPTLENMRNAIKEAEAL